MAAPQQSQEHTRRDSDSDSDSESDDESESSAGLSRRQVLGGGAAAVGAAVIASSRIGPAFADTVSGTGTGTGGAATPNGCEIGPTMAVKRADAAYKCRMDAAKYQRSLALPDHPCSGDDARYANKIASFTKCLPHDNLGQVDPAAYAALLRAVSSGLPNDFENIPMGGPMRLTDPQAAFAFALEGPDSHQLSIRSSPAFAGAERAAEMAEMYWLALARDVPFTDLATNAVVQQAAADLTTLGGYLGPRTGGAVTTGTVFRGPTSGDLAGPYLSQFLWKDIPYGPNTMSQRMANPASGVDFMTAYAEWLAVQRGKLPADGPVDATLRYMRNGRDIAAWVRRDFPFQGPLNAALILMGTPGTADAGNPYLGSKSQDGFVTFGGPYVVDLVSRVANAALKGTWYQKWCVHRALRPEVFGGRVHNHKVGAANYPLHPDIIQRSAAVQATFDRTGTYLLPQAYPSGSPAHPAYPSGHATFAGAGVTVLKALFNESAVLPNPVVASSDGLSLQPWTGAPLTVGGELNKLATNIGMARAFAGIHWRSDVIEGMRVGEAVAIGVMKDLRATTNERFGGFSLTRFDGTTITI
jgi:membrane-associated phospholipid phosphatase